MSGRFVYGIIAILALTAGYACWCGTPLIWDGAYQFCVTLIRQHPYAYLTRFHTLILWWPTVWASRATSNVWLLQAIYGFPFIIAPALSVALSWWMVREHAPGLILWAIFGVAAATLPGQIFIINDSIFQQHLFWPLFLAIFVPISRPQALMLGVLAIFQFVHQIGVPLLLGASLAAFVTAYFDPANRKRLLIHGGAMAALGVMAIGKIVITNHIPRLWDSYASQEATWWVARERWRMGVKGFPLAGLCGMWAAAIAVFVHARTSDANLRRGFARFAIFCALLGGALWVFWASDGHRWYKALDYRRWILPLTLPFFALAFVESCFLAIERRREHAPPDADIETPREWRLRTPVAYLVALSFALVIGAQSTVWLRMTSRLMADVLGDPAALIDRLQPRWSWTNETPLDHWGIIDYVVVMQGKAPRKLLVQGDVLTNMRKHPPTVPDQDLYPDPFSHPPPPGRMGWFDYRPFLREEAENGKAESRRSNPDAPPSASAGVRNGP